MIYSKAGDNIMAEASSQSIPPSFIYGLIGSIITYFICRSLSPILTNIFGTTSFKQKVNALDNAKTYHYHSLLASNIHALVQIIGTYTVVVYGREGYDDKTGGESSPAIIFDDRTYVEFGLLTTLGPTVYMGIFVGYLLADIVAAPSLKAMGYPYVLHHIAAITCWTYCTYFRVMQSVACLLQFNELSTPFLNIRQYLLTAGYKSSDVPVTCSSLSFFVIFGLIRVVPLPFVIKDWLFRDFHAIRDTIGLGGAVLLSVFFAVNSLLQISWFYVMVQKLVGMFNKKKQPKEKKQ